MEFRRSAYNTFLWNSVLIILHCTQYPVCATSSSLQDIPTCPCSALWYLAQPVSLLEAKVTSFFSLQVGPFDSWLWGNG